MKYLYTYPEKCSGCRMCSLACALTKTGTTNPKLGAITVVRDEFKRYEAPFVCMQCDDAECMAVCPKNALERNEEGVVVWNEDKCVGCRSCVAACPFGGISSLRGKIVKCDLCDGDPTCVKYCSTGALVYEEETRESIRRRKDLFESLRKN
jgi:carbon-monoxide dehydrogenase iron sulfur subunit